MCRKLKEANWDFSAIRQYSAHENIVIENYLSDNNVGLKSHSKEFNEDFLIPMYDFLKTVFPFFISRQNVCLRKRHLIGIHEPI